MSRTSTTSNVLPLTFRCSLAKQADKGRFCAQGDESKLEDQVGCYGPSVRSAAQPQSDQICWILISEVVWLHGRRYKVLSEDMAQIMDERVGTLH